MRALRARFPGKFSSVKVGRKLRERVTWIGNFLARTRKQTRIRFTVKFNGHNDMHVTEINGVRIRRFMNIVFNGF